MKTISQIKVFSHSNRSLIFIFCAVVLFFIFNILDKGISKNTYYGMVLAAIGIFFLTIRNLNTQILIKNKTLINKIFLSFGFKADIKNITKVDRGYQFIFKNWGCRLEIHYSDDYNIKQVKGIQESNYNMSDIKELIKTLKEINPSIMLHQHYQDLIDGKINDESKYKKMRI